MTKFTTNVTATHKATNEALTAGSQMQRRIAEIGVYLAAGDNNRVALLNQAEGNLKLALRALRALSEDTSLASDIARVSS